MERIRRRRPGRAGRARAFVRGAVAPLVLASAVGAGVVYVDPTLLDVDRLTDELERVTDEFARLTDDDVADDASADDELAEGPREDEALQSAAGSEAGGPRREGPPRSGQVDGGAVPDAPARAQVREEGLTFEPPPVGGAARSNEPVGAAPAVGRSDEPGEPPEDGTNGAGGAGDAETSAEAASVAAWSGVIAELDALLRSGNCERLVPFADREADRVARARGPEDLVSALRHAQQACVSRSGYPDFAEDQDRRARAALRSLRRASEAR